MSVRRVCVKNNATDLERGSDFGWIKFNVLNRNRRSFVLNVAFMVNVFDNQNGSGSKVGMNMSLIRIEGT